MSQLVDVSRENSHSDSKDRAARQEMADSVAAATAAAAAATAAAALASNRISTPTERILNR